MYDLPLRDRSERGYGQIGVLVLPQWLEESGAGGL